METQKTDDIQTAQTAPGKVRVYRFKRLGALQDDELASEIYATRQAIERFEAEMIASTAIDVDKSELDGYGRYHPERHASQSDNLRHSH